jgi:hypothetical protein
MVARRDAAFWSNPTEEGERHAKHHRDGTGSTMERVQHSSFASGPDAEDAPRFWITVRRARAEDGDGHVERRRQQQAERRWWDPASMPNQEPS